MPFQSCINQATLMQKSMEEALDSAAAAGFEGFEFWYAKVKKFVEERSLDELVALFQKTGMKAVGFFTQHLVFKAADSIGGKVK